MHDHIPRWCTALTATALACGTFLIGPAITQAAELNEVIVSDSIKITNNSTPGDSLRLYQDMRLDMDIDTTGVGTVPGDSFTIGFPAQFEVWAKQFPVQDTAGHTVATCNLTSSTAVPRPTVTCTFNNYIAQPGNNPLRGHVWLLARVVQSTTAETVEFDLNGKAVPVDLPGSGGIEKYRPQVPTAPTKAGWYRNDPGYEDVITWEIKWPGTGMPTDVALADNLGAGHSLTTSTRFTPFLQIAHTTADIKSDKWETVRLGKTASDGTTWSLTRGTNNKSLSAEVRGVKDNKFYRLMYFSKIDDPATAKPGDIFPNEAVVHGHEVSSALKYMSWAGGTLAGPGTGSIRLLKAALAGEAANLVPPDTKFTIKATYTSPDGTTNVAKDLTLTAAGTAKSLNNLATGTLVTLSETNLPPIAGASWGFPRFQGENVKDNGDGTATVTVIDQETTTIAITNVITRLAIPTSARIDIEMWSGEAAPRYDASGQVTNDGGPGDHDGGPGKLLDPHKSETLTFTVSNNGTAPLEQLAITDTTTGGTQQLKDIQCSFPDGTTGTTWNGPFAIGVQFHCTGTLPALGDGASHADQAQVTAKGIDSKELVSDVDSWHAYTPTPALPSTGTNSAPLFAIAVLCLAGGIAIKARTLIDKA